MPKSHFCHFFAYIWPSLGSAVFFCPVEGLVFLNVGFFTYGLVFFAYGWSLLLMVHSVWSFLLAVEIRFGLCCSPWKISLVSAPFAIGPVQFR